MLMLKLQLHGFTFQLPVCVVFLIALLETHKIDGLVPTF